MNKVKQYQILDESLKTFDHAKFPQVLKAITDVQALWRKYPRGYDESNRADWCDAAYTAADAAHAAAYAASRAADAADAAADATYAS